MLSRPGMKQAIENIEKKKKKKSASAFSLQQPARRLRRLERRFSVSVSVRVQASVTKAQRFLLPTSISFDGRGKTLHFSRSLPPSLLQYSFRPFPPSHQKKRSATTPPHQDREDPSRLEARASQLARSARREPQLATAVPLGTSSKLGRVLAALALSAGGSAESTKGFRAQVHADPPSNGILPFIGAGRFGGRGARRGRRGSRARTWGIGGAEGAGGLWGENILRTSTTKRADFVRFPEIFIVSGGVRENM